MFNALRDIDDVEVISVMEDIILGEISVDKLAAMEQAPDDENKLHVERTQCIHR